MLTNPKETVFAYFRCTNPSESAVEIQKQRIREYCRAMNYDLFSEITAKQPLDEAQALAICRVIRKQMHIVGPLKLIVLNLRRVHEDLYMIHRISDVFSQHGITIESVTKPDQEILALSDQDEYEFMRALAGTSLSAL